MEQQKYTRVPSLEFPDNEGDGESAKSPSCSTDYSISTNTIVLYLISILVLAFLFWWKEHSRLNVLLIIVDDLRSCSPNNGTVISFVQIRILPAERADLL